MLTPSATTENTARPFTSGAWWALFLLAALYIMSLLDRQILSLLVGPIKSEFSVTDVREHRFARLAVSDAPRKPLAHAHTGVSDHLAWVFANLALSRSGAARHPGDVHALHAAAEAFVVPPRREARQEWEILQELAQRLGHGGAYAAPWMRRLAAWELRLRLETLIDLRIRSGLGGGRFGLRAGTCMAMSA